MAFQLSRQSIVETNLRKIGVFRKVEKGAHSSPGLFSPRACLRNNIHRGCTKNSACKNQIYSTLNSRFFPQWLIKYSGEGGNTGTKRGDSGITLISSYLAFWALRCSFEGTRGRGEVLGQAGVEDADAYTSEEYQRARKSKITTN